jgi:hypothetical protein
MGGLINPPSPPSSKPTPTPRPQGSQDAEQADRQRRLDALARQRAGRAGTIATSPRGLLIPSDWAPTRKFLLGE